MIMESIIKWQTGEPKESGMYIVITKDGLMRTSQLMVEHGKKTWAFGLKVTAWCKLSDIKTYKEDKYEI